MTDRPYFLWDVPVTDAELRERLQDPDPRIRAQWQGCVLREARYADVWEYLSLAEILRDWEHLERHLGRRRGFWTFLLRGWREDGLLAS
jgi:hypothetical protein